MATPDVVRVIVSREARRHLAFAAGRLVGDGSQVAPRRPGAPRSPCSRPRCADRRAPSKVGRAAWCSPRTLVWSARC